MTFDEQFQAALPEFFMKLTLAVNTLEKKSELEKGTTSKMIDDLTKRLDKHPEET